MAISTHDCALYVCGLQKSVTSDSLRQAFGGDTADVLTAHICVDIVTGKSLGRAYVNFGSQEAAGRALNAKLDSLADPVVQINWASNDSQSRHHGQTNVCVKGIGRDVTEEQFLNYIRLIGIATVSHRFPMQGGASRGYAFVMYRTFNDSQFAMEQINSTTLNGRQLFATRYLSLKERERLLSENTPDKCNSILIENLSLEVDERTLREQFGVYGDIRLATFLADAQGSTSKSALVTYADHASAKAALNNHADDTIKVSRALAQAELAERNEERRQQRRNEVAVYVRNLDPNFSGNELKNLFATYGEVSRVEFPGPSHVNQGSGYVYLQDRSSADRAIAGLNGHNLGDRQISVELAKLRKDRVYHRFCTVAHSQRYVDPTTRALKLPFEFFYVPNVPACNVDGNGDGQVNEVELRQDDIPEQDMEGDDL